MILGSPGAFIYHNAVNVPFLGSENLGVLKTRMLEMIPTVPTEYLPYRLRIPVNLDFATKLLENICK